MNHESNVLDKFDQLRKRAEQLINQNKEDTGNIPSDVLELMHELKIHQVELQIQNEELQSAQERLNDLYHEYEELYQNAPCGYITINNKGLITHANRTAVEMLKETKDKILHSSFTDFIAKAWLDTFQKVQKRAGKTGTKQSIELILKAQKQLWVRADIAADRQNDESVLQWKLILTDITELKNAKEKAEESERLKTAFLANMSHEIRTPMNGIMGFAELLKDPSFSAEKKKKFIITIQESGSHMLDIINDLIDISKVEAGHVDVYISPTNINEQLKYLKTFFKPETDKKGIALSYKNAFKNESATIRTDKEKLYRILTNLIKNAVKYTDNGNITFGYQLKEDKIEFYVKDTGIGISDEEKKTIFNRFVQADKIEGSPQEGTGLGLSLTQAYVKILGGDLWVRSEKHKGSCFYFTIPFHPVQTAANVIWESPSSQYYNWSGKTILIVEDNQVSQDYLEELLKPTELKIKMLKKGEHVLQELKNYPFPDIILMDIRLPDANGLELIREIRSINKKIPIIVQTAYAMNEDQEKSIHAGANDYITKPIEMIKILEKIDRYL